MVIDQFHVNFVTNYKIMLVYPFGLCFNILGVVSGILNKIHLNDYGYQHTASLVECLDNI